MDVNGTRFHLLLGRDNWLGAGTVVRPADSVEWHESDHTLRLTEVRFEFPEGSGNQRVRPEDRRGAGRDRYGHWYWIGPERDEVLFQAAGSHDTERFWPQPQPCDQPPDDPGEFVARVDEPATPQRFAGLAVTDHHYLVVGVPDLPGVLVFDLHGGGPPTPIPWPTPLWPIDMAPAPGGGVWVLDGKPGLGPARYWELDRFFRICNLSGATTAPPPPADFGPKQPSASQDPPPSEERIPARPPSDIVGTPAEVAADWAIAIESLPDGSVLILDRGDHHRDAHPPALLRYRGGVHEPPTLELPLEGRRPVDMAFTPDPDNEGVTGVLMVADEQGDQAFAFRLASDGSALTPLVGYLPMRLFSGKGLVAADGDVFYDMGDRWLALIDRHRPRYQPRATVDIGAFDADEPASVWHRLAIDAHIPSGTSVAVQSRAADDPATLLNLPWRDEPDPYLRHLASEVPYHRFGARDTTDAGTWELLLQRAQGRYLQLRLTLAGDGRQTPRLWALRAHGPRFSYLDRYLPDVYREEPDAASFLDRYLANVEGMFTSLEGRIESAQRLFDVTTLDAEYLDWLAGWLGAVVDSGWEQARVRLFLRHAVTLFRRRGTPRGLVEAVRLATDPRPDSSIFAASNPSPFSVRIVESYRTRTVPGVVFGDPTQLAGPRLVEAGARWQPADGRSELDRRWHDFLTERYDSTDALADAWGRQVTMNGSGNVIEPFPPLTPANQTEATDRRDFIASSLAIPYPDVGTGDVGAYRRFLAERYRRAAALNAAWGRVGTSRVTSFDEVSLPSRSLPSDGTAFQDWIQFVSAHLPSQRAAHRFTVLVPVRPGEPDSARADRLRQVEQVVDLERPAHAAFEVKPYWAAFRVGEARVAYETSLGQGTRFVAMVLNAGRMAQGYLSGGHPWDIPDRWVVGRERVAAGTSDARKDTPDG